MTTLGSTTKVKVPAHPPPTPVLVELEPTTEPVAEPTVEPAVEPVPDQEQEQERQPKGIEICMGLGIVEVTCTSKSFRF